MLRRLFGGREIPDLITVLVTQRGEGGWDVQFISDRGPRVPKAPPPTASLTETREIVDAIISGFYMRDPRSAELLVAHEIGVGYAMYPWGGKDKVRSEAARAIGTGYFLFDVEEVRDGFVAVEQSVHIRAAAADLDELASAAAAAIDSRWSAELDGEPIAGSLSWQRTFTATGFAPYRREHDNDAAP